MADVLDMRSTEFKSSFIGFNKGEVNSFINNVLNSYEALQSKNKELQERIGELEKTLTDCRLQVYNLEKELKNSDNEAGASEGADTAQAENQAQAIVAAAQKKAEEIISNAVAEAAKTKREAAQMSAAKAAEAQKAAQTVTQNRFNMAGEQPANRFETAQSQSATFNRFETPQNQESTINRFETAQSQEPTLNRFETERVQEYSLNSFDRIPESEPTLNRFNQPPVNEMEEDVYVGEIEDNRKVNNKNLIGNEDDEEAGFEFL